jgi:hypothetical protein
MWSFDFRTLGPEVFRFGERELRENARRERRKRAKKEEKPLVNLLAIPGSDKECKKCIMHRILKILANHYL